MRLIEQLGEDCGIKFRIIVEVIFDDLVALAGSRGEPGNIKNVDLTPRVFNQPFSLENSGGYGDGWTARS